MNKFLISSLIWMLGILTLKPTNRLLIGPTNYYVSATGSDANTGLDANHPWQTIGKVNSFTFSATDSILFKRGDVFTGGIVASRSNLNFGAYGTGAKPIISGLTTVSSWTNLGGNIWQTPVTGVDVSLNLVLRNGAIQQVGRYPNVTAGNGGYFNYTTGNSTSISGTVNSSVNDWTGAEVAVRAVRWKIMKRIITSHSGTTMNWSGSNPMSPTPKPGYGYFIQRDPNTLDQDGEWYTDGSVLQMYFANNNPFAYTVQVATQQFLLKSLQTAISVTNLAFIGANEAAIRDSSTDIKIKNLDISYCGQEGIGLYNLSSTTQNYTIDSVTVNQCLATGIRIRGSNNVANLSLDTVRNCTVSNIALKAGMESGEQSGGGNGITVSAADGIYVCNNTITNVGYNGIEWKGNNAVIKYNYINNFCSVRDDGGGIYTYEQPGSSGAAPARTNRSIIGNIIVNGISNTFGTDGNNVRSSVVGIYTDEGVRNVIIDSNTISDVYGNGTHGNSIYDITFRANTVFNTVNAMSIQRLGDDANPLTGMVFKKNIFYPYRLRYSNLAIDQPSVTTKDADIANMYTVLDSNYYSLRAGTDTSLDAQTTYLSGANFSHTYNVFSYITGTIGKETHSTNIANTGTISYNPSNSPMVVNFTGLSKIDVFGNVYNNSATVQPWRSIIFIPNGLAPTLPQSYYTRKRLRR